MFVKRYFRLQLERGSLRNDRSAVGQHLGHAGGELIRIIAHSDDPVRAALGRVLDHEIEGVLPGSFAEIGIERDVAAKEGLQAGAESADNAPRPDNNAPHNPKIFGKAMAREFIRSSDELRVDVSHTLDRTVWKIIASRMVELRRASA